jgi:protein SCO1
MKTLLLLLSSSMFLASCAKHETSSPATSVVTADTSPQNSGSIYSMNMSFDNQYGQHVSCQSLQGKVRIMAMIFTHCPAACPRITEDIKAAEKLLTPSEQKSVQFTLISFDTKRDTSGTLMAYYREHSLDTNWQLLHGSAENVRMVANLLNVKYKEWPTDDFTHENFIFVIDKNGNIVLRREGLEKDPKELADKITSVL